MILRVLEKATETDFSYHVFKLNLDGPLAGMFKSEIVKANETNIRVNEGVFFEIGSSSNWKALTVEQGNKVLNEYNELRQSKGWKPLIINRSEILVGDKHEKQSGNSDSSPRPAKTAQRR